jgi:hypothetical protein
VPEDIGELQNAHSRYLTDPQIVYHNPRTSGSESSRELRRIWRLDAGGGAQLGGRMQVIA